MARLEIKVDGDDVEAEKMLLLAKTTLKALLGVEKAYFKERGMKPSIRWRVDMQSGFSFGLIAIRAEPGPGAAAAALMVQEFWDRAHTLLKDADG